MKTELATAKEDAPEEAWALGKEAVGRRLF